MAVFTRIDPSDVKALLQQYHLGEFADLQEIGQGIENSNFFVLTREGNGLKKWVLTLFETLDASELPFFMKFTALLSEQGLPVPAPLLDRQGQVLHQLKGKPAALFPCFPGDWEREPSVQSCRQMGETLARMHCVSVAIPAERLPVRSIQWMKKSYTQLQGVSGFVHQKLLAAAIDKIAVMEPATKQCKKGVVHGDLFRDNVLFEQGQISGIIDFYHACEDTLMFDLAVVANDWCFDAQTAGWDVARVSALIESYQKNAPPDAFSVKAWPAFLLLAAVRFWISRLISRHIPGYQGSATAGDITKEPEEFRVKVEAALELLGR